jgi:CRISPR/Cas system-associated endoribonuclease Cas2
LQKISQTTPILNKGSHCEISIYKGELTQDVLTEQIAKIYKAFKNITDKDYFQVLKERIKENNFSNEKLKDAVNHVIDTCVYPTPTIANFLSYDKNVKLYTYDQKLKLINEIGAELANRMYLSVKIEGMSKPMWANVNDIEKYKLERWSND